MFSNPTIENDQILIPMAGLGIGINEIRLRTFVGSCVAICLYDKSKKICGMAHVMLPKNNTGKSTFGTKFEGKYADEAINTIIKKMKEIHPDIILQAKIVGGAKIFDCIDNNSTLNIGKRNVSAIRLILKEKKIPLVSEHLSISNGCWATFDCNSQEFFVKENNGEKII